MSAMNKKDGGSLPVEIKQFRALKEMNKSVVKEKKYFLQFICTKDDKFLLPFSRRPVDIDLQALLDKHDACLSINVGMIDIMMNDGLVDPNRKVIRLIDEKMTELDVYNLITK